MKVKWDFDDEKWQAILKNLKGLPDIDVGVFDPDIAVYAAVQEYGNRKGTVPARRWLSRSLEVEEDKLMSLYVSTSKWLYQDQYSPMQVAHLIGQGTANQVKGYVRGGNFPPALKQSTIEKKGFDKQMVDTGDMRDAITYKVRK